MKEKITEYIQSEHSGSLLPSRDINTNLLYFFVKKESIVSVVQDLKENPEFGFSFLNDLTSIDWLGKREERFEVIYLLRSPKLNHFKLQLRVPVGEGELVPSLTSLYPGANWPEREIYDLMGIQFSGHPQMERLIMPDNFIGHPLRKDFPLEGPGQDYLIEDLLTIHIKDDITS